MKLVGLAFDATAVRALGAVVDAVPAALPLDGAEPVLPLALSLQHRTIEVGRAGRLLSRQLPHLACLSFLADLGTTRHWVAGRHKLDAGRALGLVCERIRPAMAGVGGIGFSVPEYLTTAQVHLVNEALKKTKLPVLGSLAAPLALGLAGWLEHPWSGAAVVLDVDDHAFSCTLLTRRAGVLVRTESVLESTLSLRSWKSRVLDAVADRCVHHSRRDPRDSASAEQMLYDQLDVAFDAARQGRLVELDIQTATWFQNLILRQEEVDNFSRPLTDAALDVVETVRELAATEPPRTVILSASANTLPGLHAGLRDLFMSVMVLPLSADAAALGAFTLADTIHACRVAAAHFADELPLPPTPVSRLDQSTLRLRDARS